MHAKNRNSANSNSIGRKLIFRKYEIVFNVQISTKHREFSEEKKLFIRIDEAEFNVESLGDIIASAKTQIERDRLHTI